MKTNPSIRRAFTFLLLLGLFFSLPGPLSFVPSLDAASASASARIIKKLKKQVARLKKQLAAAMSVPPAPAPFIEMVTVGDVGNALDPADGDDRTAGVQNFGTVPYEFSIGKYEVTLAQYTAFLNAVATTDAFGLYATAMAIDLSMAGIARSGTAGSFIYSVIGPGTRPVAYVSWFDAARFCNWLHNGRPTGLQTVGTTERGAYTLDGAVSGGLTINRNPGAKFWIPSEDEWYKAAYHQPQSLGGPLDSYWDYPTKRDVPNTPGNIVGPSENHANFVTANFFYSVTQSASYDSGQNYLTAVGSYSGSASFYGTFDQGGNVWELNDSVIGGTSRGLRGASWTSVGNYMPSSYRNFLNPVIEDPDVGFRVASP